MNPNVEWKISETIQFEQLTAPYVDEALHFIDTIFFPHENVFHTWRLADDQEVMKELRDLTMSAAKDGVTVIAIDTSTKKVIGVALNKIQVHDNPVFLNYAKNWKQPKSKAVVDFIANFYSLCNLFEFCKVDSILEIMFMATLPEYRGKGIAKRLTELSIELGRALKKGVNVKKSIDGNPLTLEPVPKIACAIFTSTITQKIGQKVGFTIAAEQNYSDLNIEGLTFEHLAESGTTKLTLEYKEL